MDIPETPDHLNEFKVNMNKIHHAVVNIDEEPGTTNTNHSYLLGIWEKNRNLASDL